jgi:hypothetical protein
VVQHGADRRLITIGRYPIISLADAREEAKRLLAEMTLSSSAHAISGKTSTTSSRLAALSG